MKIQKNVIPEHFNIRFTNGSTIQVKDFNLYDDRIEMINMRGEPDIRQLTNRYKISKIDKIPVKVTYEVVEFYKE